MSVISPDACITRFVQFRSRKIAKEKQQQKKLSLQRKLCFALSLHFCSNRYFHRAIASVGLNLLSYGKAMLGVLGLPIPRYKLPHIPGIIIINLIIIIHQTHYEKSDWSRAFNQFTIACELDMINAISAAEFAFIMSSSTSAWLLSPLECSPQKQNG